MTSRSWARPEVSGCLCPALLELSLQVHTGLCSGQLPGFTPRPDWSPFSVPSAFGPSSSFRGVYAPASLELAKALRDRLLAGLPASGAIVPRPHWSAREGGHILQGLKPAPGLHGHFR